MKILSIIIVLFLLAFQGCDAGDKKNESKRIVPTSKKSGVSTLAHTEKTNIISKAETISNPSKGLDNTSDFSANEISSDSTDQLKDTSQSTAWKKEVSKKLKPIPLSSSASQTINLSDRNGKKSAKTVRKKELVKADKLASSKSVDAIGKLELSKDSNFKKIREVESQTTK